jgi:aminobenzoyl-glutamate transport protein
LLLTVLGLVGLGALGVFQENGAWKPLFDSVVTLVALLFFVPGVVWAWKSGRVRSTADIANLTAESMATMGGYLALAFAASQFIAWFGWSNLGTILAVRGAETLRGLGLEGPFLLLGFVLLTCVLDLFVASASEKWAVVAPVFVPMLMLLGVSPAATQAAYRVGDSVTNIVTPLMPYFPLVLTYARRYAPDIGLGTLLGLMVPYASTFLLAWMALFGVWIVLDWPLGPGAYAGWP